MQIKVVWKNYRDDLPERNYWDQAMIEDLFSGEMWSWENQYEFTHQYSFDGVEDGCVVVLPARNQADSVAKLNADIARLRWVVIMLTGDEESVYPVEQIQHPNMRIWVMSPQMGRHDNYRRLGSGYTPKQRETIKKAGYQEKTLNWLFAGQVNHSRRKKCAEALDGLQGGEMYLSGGFAQGMDQGEYYMKLAQTKIAPCPSGGFTPDTFRLFESLESGCFPIADEVTEVMKYEKSYWEWFFQGPIPFYPLTDYGGLTVYIKEALKDWQAKANKVFAWWIAQKRQMAYNLRQDIKDVSGIDFEDDITILIPTSVTQDHPSTEMIEKTIADVRAKLPKAEIIIMIDGLRPQFKDRKKNYEEYIARLLWLANYKWNNVLPIIFDQPTHQVGMTRKALEYVKTPTILYVEHDAPICPDPEFDYSFKDLVKTILSGEANAVRFHHEASILDEHKDLMIGAIESVNNVPMQRTMQWSQRPHLARTEWYKKMLTDYFAPDAYGMIEDHIYGKVLNDCKEHGMMGWYNWRVWIFAPTITGEGNWKRSYTLDGRKTDDKFDNEFHF